MSFFDPDFDSRADYDMDGGVDDFEYGLFLHEMEEEDRAIEEGRAFFGVGSASYEPQEDYIGLDLEQCTILDPDYDGSESLDELASRYGIDLTEDDIRFYRESQTPSPAAKATKGISAETNAQMNKIIDSYLMEHSPEYRKSVQVAEARRNFEARGERVENLQSWKLHAPKEDLAKYRDRRRRYIGEWVLAIFLVLLFLAAPITWMWVSSDDADAAGPMTGFCLVLIVVILFFAFKLLGPSLEASESNYKRDVETIIIVSCENERERKQKNMSTRYHFISSKQTRPVHSCTRLQLLGASLFSGY